MNSNSKDQVKLIRESLDSIIKPYIHLIEE